MNLTRFYCLLAGLALLSSPGCPSTNNPTVDVIGADETSASPTPDANAEVSTPADGESEATTPDLPPPAPTCPCVHGTCGDSDATECQCYPGWQGDLCQDLGDIVVPWDAAGPYGTGIRDRVADITLPLMNQGDVALSSLWTGEDSFLFALKYGSSSYSKSRGRSGNYKYSSMS